MIRQFIVASFVVAYVTGCASSSDTGSSRAGLQCQSAGGHCVLGSAPCGNKSPTNDCNPNTNPGGAFCCLDDAACSATGVHAADYDQSCTTAADCVGVGEGSGCYACEFACQNAAINRSAEAKFKADVAKTPAGAQAASARCGCPAAFEPCCIQGKCHADLACSGIEGGPP